MGLSNSKSESEQKAEAFLSQQFYGTCDFSCTNLESNINIDLINSVVSGDINLTQKCAVDSNCMMSSTSDVMSDVMFKAQNSTNATNASNVFAGAVFNFDNADTFSRQTIKQHVNQETHQKCKVASLNQTKDVHILAANSKIGGNINIAQDGSVQGKCRLSNNFTAATAATSMATGTAKTGKEKKGNKGIVFGSIIALFVILSVLALVAKFYTGSRDKGVDSKIKKKLAFARVQAGCPDGSFPILDPETGAAIIDPNTIRPVCPPPSFNQKRNW